MSKQLSTLSIGARYNDTTASVSCWTLCSGTKDKDVLVGYNIKSLMDNIYGRLIYMQDINIMSSYILSFLIDNDFVYIDDRYDYMDKRKKKQANLPCWWNIIRSSKGEVYTIYFSSYGRDCEIRSSKAILLNSVNKIAKDWGIIKEIDDMIDDNMYQHRGPLDKTMIDKMIFHNMTLYKIIVGLRDHGKQLTATSNAMKDWMRRDKVVAKLLNTQLPDDIDKDLRYGYRGGLVWNDESTLEVDLGHGFIMDMHSIYGYVEKAYPMPVGIPERIDGLAKQQSDKLYFFKYKVTGRVKPDGIPCISDQGKNGIGDTCMDVIQDKELVLTSYDLELLQDNYDLSVCDPVYTYEFDCVSGMFDNFVDFWYDKKKHSTGSDRVIAKGNLTTNYGGLGKKDMIVTVPKIMDGCLRWVHVKDEEGKILKTKPKFRYVAVPAMITSIARWLIVAYAKEAMKECRVVAIDTDAIHCICDNIPVCIPQGNELGQFGIEAEFRLIRHLGPKQYGFFRVDRHKPEYKLSGATDKVKSLIDWNKFYKGETIEKSRAYPCGLEGGVIREYRDYII